MHSEKINTNKRVNEKKTNENAKKKEMEKCE